MKNETPVERDKMKKQKNIDDIVALRAFVMPDNFPFLLEVYAAQGKDENALLEDIKKAREKYKELVKASKQKNDNLES